MRFFYPKFQEDWRLLGWRQQSLRDSWRERDSDVNFPFRRMDPRWGHIWTKQEVREEPWPQPLGTDNAWEMRSKKSRKAGEGGCCRQQDSDSLSTAESGTHRVYVTPSTPSTWSSQTAGMTHSARMSIGLASDSGTNQLCSLGVIIGPSILTVLEVSFKN